MTESLLWNYKDGHEGELLRISSKKSSPRYFKSASWHTEVMWFHIKEIIQKKCPFIFQFQRHERNIGQRINNADTSLLCARAFIPSGLWLKSPSAPGSKHYYMALCLGFSSQMGIWGPTWRQIGYQSQGWYKDRLWKSIGRQSYIGLAYLFLHHSVRGPSFVQKVQHIKPDLIPLRQTERKGTMEHPIFLAPCSHHIKPWSQHRKRNTYNIVRVQYVHIYQYWLCQFLCRDHSYIPNIQWILHFAGMWMVEAGFKYKEMMFLYFSIRIEPRNTAEWSKLTIWLTGVCIVANMGVGTP